MSYDGGDRWPWEHHQLDFTDRAVTAKHRAAGCVLNEPCKLVALVTVDPPADDPRVLLSRWMVWATTVAFKSPEGEALVADTDRFLAKPRYP